ncbi:PAH-inducible cytochrome P450 monooxygenase [Mycena venus]|uniref:PAH-inducible cytochrome P450 monooxygenase n=1 Tax=Mycena venus TaxID=2733690 RepID=A0A8H7CTW1_9AGAR|nr:PAH-inducible cytochrome P450 monooxygenase [Mycena venus]
MDYISPSFGIPAVLGLATALVFVTSKSRSSLVAKLPGPPSPSWIYGNMLQWVFPSIYGEFEFAWQKQFGTVYRIKGMFGANLIMVSDAVAVQHVINSHSFIRAPTQVQKGKLIFGERSVYCAEGDTHRRFRSALSPGFAPAVVRSFSPIFSDAAQRIVQEWDRLCSSGSPALVNVCDLLDHATLDIISEGAYRLIQLRIQKHPLAQTHLHVLSAGFNRSQADLFADALLPYIPTFILRGALRLPTAAFRALVNFRSVTDAMSTKIIRSKADEKTTDHALDNDVLIKGLSGQRKEKLTASELAEQVRIILLGGQDTSADALAWCLYELAKDPAYQGKLREEIELHRRSGDGQMEYDSMPLLNAFIKEALRFYPAAPYLERVAGEDLVIPLASEITTTSGERISHLPVKKGQFIAVAIASYQRLEAVWGDDADQFKPSRWLEGDPCKGKALGPYAHLMSFSGGYRVCAGWRFAVLEMQIILAELVLNFSFALSKNDPVRPLYAGILVPITEKGVKGLPLFIERISQ